MSMTTTPTTPTLESLWPAMCLPESQRSAWMAGAQAVLVLLRQGASAEELHAEVLLWARTHIGRT